MSLAVEVVADSVNPTGNRLTTFKLLYPRNIHDELLTHRAFSRNSASGRAIPWKRMKEMIEADPATPRYWGTKQSGMTAGAEPSADILSGKGVWESAMRTAIFHATQLDELGFAKEIVNRVVQPYMHIEIVLSATEWNNWWLLRDHPSAERCFGMQELAAMMHEAYKASEPIPRAPMKIKGEMLRSPCEYWRTQNNAYPDLSWWHLPFVNVHDAKHKDCWYPNQHGLAIRESVAHCAWVSYGNVEGKPDYTQEDCDRTYAKLVGSAPIHASPAEHVAVACSTSHRHGNFVGFCAWRQFLPNQSGGDYNA